MYTACSPALFSDFRFESLRSGIPADKGMLKKHVKNAKRELRRELSPTCGRTLVVRYTASVTQAANRPLPTSLRTPPDMSDRAA